jgi:hypothetical protein
MEIWNENKKKEIAMKTISKLFLVIITILLIGCSQIKRDGQNDELTITGSGTLVSQEVAISDFDQVKAGLYFDLSIHQGEEPHVVLTSDDNFIDYIQVAQAGNGISFGFKPGQAYDISGVTLKADITTPRLSKLELSGSSHAHFDGYQSNQLFEANLTGSSSLTGEMQLEAAKLNTYGSSYVKLGGRGANLALEACGANLVDLSEFNVEDAALEVSCNSKVIVNVAGMLETKASQYAQITFVGNPAVKVFDVHESAAVQSK